MGAVNPITRFRDRIVSRVFFIRRFRKVKNSLESPSTPVSSQIIQDLAGKCSDIVISFKKSLGRQTTLGTASPSFNLKFFGKNCRGILNRDFPLWSMSTLSKKETNDSDLPDPRAPPEIIMESPSLATRWFMLMTSGFLSFKDTKPLNVTSW